MSSKVIKLILEALLPNTGENPTLMIPQRLNFKKHSDSLSRLVGEAVMIQVVGEEEMTLNSKSEWHSVSLTRISIIKICNKKLQK